MSKQKHIENSPYDISFEDILDDISFKDVLSLDEPYQSYIKAMIVLNNINEPDEGEMLFNFNLVSFLARMALDIKKLKENSSQNLHPL